MTSAQTYEDLLAIAKSNPEGADFGELRLAYARSAHYKPYGAEAMPDRSLYDAFGEEDIERAIKAIDRRLVAYYLDIEAHMVAASVYERIGDKATSAHHRKFALGLLDSIFESGDGRSYETALAVIDVAEEYAVLGVLGLELSRQSLRDHGSHWFDVLECRGPKTGQTAELYFNIDLPHGWLNRQLDEDPEEFMKQFERVADLGPERPERKGRKWWQFWKRSV